MRRTIHGEALQERRGGVFAGASPRRYFFTRSVWCPTCQATPNRRCTSVAGDYHVAGKKKPHLVDGLRAGSMHTARFDRATWLTELARNHPRVLAGLAYRGPPHSKRTTSTAFGPLFTTPPTDRGSLPPDEPRDVPHPKETR